MVKNRFIRCLPLFLMLVPLSAWAQVGGLPALTSAPGAGGSQTYTLSIQTLLTDTGATTAVLTTPDRETRARRFYRIGGWQDLVLGLRFPGDPRTFAVLGKEL